MCVFESLFKAACRNKFRICGNRYKTNQNESRNIKYKCNDEIKNRLGKFLVAYLILKTSKIYNVI